MVEAIDGVSSSPATGTKRKRDDSIANTATTKVAHIKLSGWANNEQFSDVTIRYGSKTFYGHRIVLVSTSSWFKAALGNPRFLESSTQEIKLEDDNEQALTVMLGACYDLDDYQDLPPWPAAQLKEAHIATSRIDIAIFHVGVYTVADKYDAPKVAQQACTWAMKWFKAEVDTVHDQQSAHNDSLRKFIEKIYSTTGHRSSSDRLRSSLSGAITRHPAISPFMYNAALVGIIDEIVEDVPQLGSDLFLVARKSSKDAPNETTIGTCRKIKCVSCGKEWSKAGTLCYTKTHCAYCGRKEA